MNNTTRKPKDPKNYHEEGINEQVKLHTWNHGSQGTGRRTSQTAHRPPNPLGLQNWISVKTKEPPYNTYINIWDGKEVYFNWMRISDGIHNYYMNDVSNDLKRDIKYWSYPFQKK